MSEERMKILQLLADGKITADDAAKLLDVVAEPKRGGTSGAALVDDIKRTVEDVIHAIPKESIDEVKEAVRETLREGREAAHRWRHWARGNWGPRLAATLGGGHEASAPFEDVRATAATRLVVRNTRGDVRLSRSTDGQLRVRATRRVWATEAGEAERLAQRLPIDVREEDGVVTVEGPGARPFHERLRVDFEIAVPEGLAVDAHLVRGNVIAEGLQLGVSITLVKGDIRSADCGRLSLQSVSGDIVVTQAAGAVTARAVRGDVRIVDASGDVDATTKRGDVAVRVSSAGRVDLSTIRGDIHLRTEAFAPGGAVDLHTVNGDVAVRLGAPARCRIDATTVAGEVSSSLPLQDVRAHRRRLAGTLGAAEATLQISATRGDITLASLESETPASQAPPA